MKGGSHRPGGQGANKPSLLVLEYWGLGDLALAVPFLRAAKQAFNVTVLVRSGNEPVLKRLVPGVEVVGYSLPWTAFTGKYRLWRWPWWTLLKLSCWALGRRFDCGVSARWDARDHAMLWFWRVKTRIGYPRTGSHRFLTDIPPPAPRPLVFHRIDEWRGIAAVLGLEIQLPDRTAGVIPRRVLLHSGAAHPVRVWPLERWHDVVRRLRGTGLEVDVLCDRDQKTWWTDQGEEAHVPGSVDALIDRVMAADLFLGNDSGPGHLAAATGIPTFTVFGPQLPEIFSPIHPRSAWVEGAPCDFKPCFDACRFASAHCLVGVGLESAWTAIVRWLEDLRTTGRDSQD